VRLGRILESIYIFKFTNIPNNTMYAIRDNNGKEIGYAGNIIGPVEVELAKDFKPGQRGQPTLQQFDEAIRRELSDFLEPNHPIIFVQRRA
jgi:hypothetical protein